ncbi:hypothetical protein BH23CHL1_BH23CHL1_25940 [soil metagenome]
MLGWSRIPSAFIESEESGVAAEHIHQDEQIGRVEQFTDEEAREFFDRAVRRYLHMSGDEFIRRYDAGEYDEDPDQHPIMMMISLLPLVDHPFRSL